MRIKAFQSWLLVLFPVLFFFAPGPKEYRPGTSPYAPEVTAEGGRTAPGTIDQEEPLSGPYALRNAPIPLLQGDHPSRSHVPTGKGPGYALLLSFAFHTDLHTVRDRLRLKALPYTDVLSAGQRLLYPKHWFW